MRIIVDGFEIELKAKMQHRGGNFNKRDTMAFLNTLSLYLSDLADYMEADNKTAAACAPYRRKDADGIYKLLKEAGLYN